MSKHLTISCREATAGLLFILSTIAYTAVQAQSYSGENFPKEFRYQNKPIDPLCITKLSSNSMARASAVNIDECSKHPDYQVTKVNEDLQRKGFNGYDFTYKLPNQTEMQGSTYYKYIGKVNDHYVIYTMQNDSGSGFMTRILLIERIGNKLRLLQEVAGGNRCNTGIDPNIQLKDKLLNYKTSLTPYGVIAFSGAMPENIQACNDLADCASCCVGDAMFQYDFSNESPMPKLMSLTLNKDAGKDEVFSQGKLQACFNKVLRDFNGKTKNTKLSGDQIKDFAQQFNSTCIK